MRALVLTHVFPRAHDDPSAPFLLTWAQALRDAGHDVRVVAPHDAGVPERRDVGGIEARFVRYAPERLEVLAYRGEMHRIALRPSGPPLLAGFLGAMARAVRAEARRWRPDVLHVHWWMPGAVVARLARVRVPTVVHLHGTDVGVVEARPRLAGVARWALCAANRVEVVSSDLGDRLHRTTGLRADAVNPMPLHPSRVEPLTDAERAAGRADRTPDDPPVVLAIGRLVPEKGFADLVEAAALLDHPVRVVVVGDGPERDRLAALGRARGIDLDLRGRVDPSRLRAVYAEADVVVQPSHKEGFGLVAAEAAALGLPVVATDSGGVRDVLGDAGLVPTAAPAELAAALAAALAGGPAGAPDVAALSPAAAAARTAHGWAAVVARRTG